MGGQEEESEEDEVTDDLKIWLPPFLTLLGTLIVVVFTAWLNTRAVLGQVEKGMAELRLELKLEIEHLRLELSEFRGEARTDAVEVKHRIKSLEDRAGLIYRP
jgi:hypothetical protein